VPEGLPERIELHRVHTSDDAAVPRRLLASWQRSEDYGVPLDAVEPVFTGTDDLSSLFFECGNEVLADLHRTLASEPVSMMLTDAEGVVLSRFVGRPQPAAGARRCPPRAGLRILGAGGGHQRARPRACRQGAHARARRRALLAEPVHLHVRGGPRPRSVVGQAGGQRQPDHLVALL